MRRAAGGAAGNMADRDLFDPLRAVDQQTCGCLIIGALLWLALLCGALGLVVGYGLHGGG